MLLEHPEGPARCANFDRASMIERSPTLKFAKIRPTIKRSRGQIGNKSGFEAANDALEHEAVRGRGWIWRGSRCVLSLVRTTYSK